MSLYVNVKYGPTFANRDVILRILCNLLVVYVIKKMYI